MLRKAIKPIQNDKDEKKLISPKNYQSKKNKPTLSPRQFKKSTPIQEEDYSFITNEKFVSLFQDEDEDDMKSFFSDTEGKPISKRSEPLLFLEEEEEEEQKNDDDEDNEPEPDEYVYQRQKKLTKNLIKAIENVPDNEIETYSPENLKRKKTPSPIGKISNLEPITFMDDEYNEDNEDYEEEEEELNEDETNEKIRKLSKNTDKKVSFTKKPTTKKITSKTTIIRKSPKKEEPVKTIKIVKTVKSPKRETVSKKPSSKTTSKPLPVKRLPKKEPVKKNPSSKTTSKPLPVSKNTIPRKSPNKEPVKKLTKKIISKTTPAPDKFLDKSSRHVKTENGGNHSLSMDAPYDIITFRHLSSKMNFLVSPTLKSKRGESYYHAIINPSKVDDLSDTIGSPWAEKYKHAEYFFIGEGNNLVYRKGENHMKIVIISMEGKLLKIRSNKKILYTLETDEVPSGYEINTNKPYEYGVARGKGHIEMIIFY